MTNDALALVAEFRRRRRAVHRLGRALADLQDALDDARELAGDAEYRLARHLRGEGPLTLDGRTYEREDRDGCPAVLVTVAADAEVPGDPLAEVA